jgi:hypothetical protein
MRPVAVRRGAIANTLVKIGERHVEEPVFRPLTPFGRELGRLAREELLRARARVQRQLRGRS